MSAPRRRSAPRVLLVAIVCVLAMQVLGLLSARFAGTAAANPWFEALAKPPLQPGNAVFGLAWAILYALMGIALALVVTGAKRGKPLAILLFAAQLAANLVWAPLFFREHRMGDAFWLLVAIGVLALLTTLAFARVRVSAAVLMLPYLAWLGFAGLLNWQIVELNPAGGAAISTGAEAAVPPQE